MSNTHDKFLTGSPDKEESFLRDLSALLNMYGIDNAVNAPDYALANYLRESLHTLRHTLHMHYFPRGHRGYAQGAPYPWGELTADETVELAREVRTQFLNSFPKTAEVGIRCFNCDGKGFIVPLKAMDAPTLDRWLNSMRDVQASGEALQKELDEFQDDKGRTISMDFNDGHPITHLEIDPTKLSDAEKARILHAYDWSDEAPDNALQRAGRRLMEVKRENHILTEEQQAQLGRKLSERPDPNDNVGNNWSKKGGDACSQ